MSTVIAPEATDPRWLQPACRCPSCLAAIEEAEEAARQAEDLRREQEAAARSEATRRVQDALRAAVFDARNDAIGLDQFIKLARQHDMAHAVVERGARATVSLCLWWGFDEADRSRLRSSCYQHGVRRPGYLGEDNGITIPRTFGERGLGSFAARHWWVLTVEDVPVDRAAGLAAELVAIAAAVKPIAVPRDAIGARY